MVGPINHGSAMLRAVCLSRRLSHRLDCLQSCATGVAIHRASTSVCAPSAAAPSGLVEFNLAAQVFGAKNGAPKWDSTQRPSAAVARAAPSVALFSSPCAFLPSGSLLSPGQSSPSSALSAFVSICQQRRHLSTSCPAQRTMDHLTNNVDWDSSSSEGEDSTKMSLPTLSESGHKQFQGPSLVDCNFLKTPLEKVYRIIVEGNIGSGKTTFLQIFAKNCASLRNKPLIVPEPIDLWRNVGGQNIFQLLADDPKRWSFAFQSYVQLTMIKIHEMQPTEGNFKVMERSLFSARYCFVENLINKGLLQPSEYFILDEWFKTSLPAAQVDLIIYLKSDPDVVFDRIKKRGRPEEAGITLEYLRTLHELHEDWLVRKKFPLPAQVLTIDANTPLDQIVSVYQEKAGGILREHLVTV